MLRQPLKYLRLGATEPKFCVALFHGLGGSRNELKPLAERWRDALPTTAFVLFEAPDRDYFARTLLSGEWSGDWHRFPHLRSAFRDDESYAAMVTRCVSERCDHVSAELDTHLAEMGLGDEQLVLAGFSQGAAISAYTGLRRQCLGIVPVGGPCPPRPELLPENDHTHICAIVGDADHCAPHEEISRIFAQYDAASGDAARSCTTHVIPGMGHTVGPEIVGTIALEFLQRLLRLADNRAASEA